MGSSLYWAISCESIFAPKHVNELGKKKSGQCFSNDYGICKLNFLVNLTASWTQQQKLRYVGAGSSLMRTSFSGVREDVVPNTQNKGYEIQAALYSPVSVYATVVY